MSESLPSGIAIIFSKDDVPELASSLRRVKGQTSVTVVALKFGQAPGDFADLCLDLRAAGIPFEQARVEGLPLRPDEDSVEAMVRGISHAHANFQARGPLGVGQAMDD